MMRCGMAEYGGFCRSMASMDWRIVAEYGGLCHSMTDYVERISSIFTTPLELKGQVYERAAD